MKKQIHRFRAWIAWQILPAPHHAKLMHAINFMQAYQQIIKFTEVVHEVEGEQEKKPVEFNIH